MNLKRGRCSWPGPRRWPPERCCRRRRPRRAAAGQLLVWDNEANMPGACADQYTSFSEPDVGIWNDPYRRTTVLGTGARTQTFATTAFVSDGLAWSCGSGVTTRFWYRATTRATA
jgi:hypothetical protein